MAIIAFILFFGLIFLIPGMLLFLVVNSYKISTDQHFSVIPEAFIFSFVFGVIPGCLVLFFKLNLEYFIILFSASIISLIIINWKSLKNNLGNKKNYIIILFNFEKSKGLFFLFLLSLSVLIVATFLCRLGYSSDNWFYSAAVRHFLISDEIYSHNTIFIDSTIVETRNLYNVLGLFYATISFFSSIDSFKLVFLYTKIPLIIIAVLSMASLAYVLAKDIGATLVSVFILSIFCLLSTYTQEGVGRILIEKISHDKSIMAFIFLPIAIKYLYLFSNERNLENFLSFTFVTIGLGILHPQGIILISFTWLGFMMAILIFEWNFSKLKNISLLIIPIIIFSSFVFYQKIIREKFPADVYKISYNLKELKKLYSFKLPDGTTPVNLTPQNQNMPRARYLKPLSKGFYISHPNIINQPMYILTIMIGIYWIFDKQKRKSSNYQFLIALTLLPLIVIFNPLIAPLFGYLSTAHKMWRVIWLIPVSIVISIFLLDISKRFTLGNNLILTFSFFLTIILTGSLLYEYRFNGNKIMSDIKTRFYSNSWLVGNSEYTRKWKEIDDIVLKLNTTKNTKWLLAPTIINTRIPTYYGNVGILAFRGYSQTSGLLFADHSKKKIKDRVNIIRRFGNGRLSPENLERAVREYTIDTVVITKEHKSKYFPKIETLGFQKVYQNNMYIIAKRIYN